MIFRTRSSPPVEFSVDLSHTCVVIEDTEVIKDGVRVVVPKGEIDLYSKVQADKASCNVYNILQRFTRGDVDVIQQRVGQFIDTVGMPTSIIEAHRKLDTMRKSFESMPAEFKEKFGGSFDTFVEKGATLSPADLAAMVSPKKAEVNNNVEE